MGMGVQGDEPQKFEWTVGGKRVLGEVSGPNWLAAADRRIGGVRVNEHDGFVAVGADQKAIFAVRVTF